MRIGDLLKRSAHFHRQSEAIEDAHRRVTYGQLREEVSAMSAGLAALGLRPGDRAAILARNRIEYVVFYFAVAELGAVSVPLNWRLGVHELEYILRDAGARLLVAEPAFAGTVDGLESRLPSLTHVVVGDEPLPGWLAAKRVPVPSEESSAVAAPDDAVIQMYTSGTTGSPKGALLTHRNMVALTTSWLVDMPLAPRADRFLQVTPLFHVGAVLMVLSNVAMGSSLLLLPEFAPGPAAEALAERGVTKALFVPAMLRWLLSEPNIADRRFPDLRMIVYGASPIPASLLVQAMTTFDCDFLQGYGLTETAGVLTSLRPEDHVGAGEGASASRLASAGRAVLCSRVRVVDSEDRPLPPGEPGELVAKGDNVSPGYWNLPEVSREALRGGWFHTGDVATMDEEGFVTIVDRVKDMILVGGENVYPREVEIALDAHPEVAESAVIGTPHDFWGEQVHALVVVNSGATVTDRELIGHCRQRLARFKCPTKVEFVDALPRNAAGKLMKVDLREPYWSGRDRRV